MTTASHSKRRIQRTAQFSLESLDDRIVPSAIGAEGHLMLPVAVVQVRPETEAPLAHDPVRSERALDAHHGGHRHRAALPANVGAKLRLVYTQYVTYVGTGANGTFTATGVGGVVISGTHVGVNVHTTDTAHFQGLIQKLEGAGLQITQSSAASGNVGGILPIGQLPTVANISPAVSVTLPSNVGEQLQSLFVQYETFVNAGGKGTFTPTGVSNLVISGTNVGVNIHTTDIVHFGKLLTQLEGAGLHVTASSIGYGIIDGMLPIGQLPTVVAIAPTSSITPLFKPLLN